MAGKIIQIDRARRRRPRGIPSGGQFARTVRGEAPIPHPSSRSILHPDEAADREHLLEWGAELAERSGVRFDDILSPEMRLQMLRIAEREGIDAARSFVERHDASDQEIDRIGARLSPARSMVSELVRDHISGASSIDRSTRRLALDEALQIRDLCPGDFRAVLRMRQACAGVPVRTSRMTLGEVLLDERDDERVERLGAAILDEHDDCAAMVRHEFSYSLPGSFEQGFGHAPGIRALRPGSQIAQRTLSDVERAQDSGFLPSSISIRPGASGPASFVVTPAPARAPFYVSKDPLGQRAVVPKPSTVMIQDRLAQIASTAPGVPRVEWETPAGSRRED